MRYDYQIPWVEPFDVIAVDRNSKAWTDYVTPKTIDLLDKLLPAAKIDTVKATDKDGQPFSWKTFSPRFGVTWDVFGNGKTLAKLSFAQYGEFMGVGSSSARWKPGGTSGWMNTYWWDQNNDGKIDYTELYWYNYRTAPLYQLYRIFDNAGNFTGNWADAAGAFWGDFEYTNPQKLVKPYRLVDKKATDSRTTELILTFERELFTDAAIQINGTFRRYDHFTWALKYFPETGQKDNQGWYVNAGKPPANIPGIGSTKDAAKHDYYYASTQQTAYSPWTLEERMPNDRHNDYYGLDIIFNKRLSKGWMFSANVTLQTCKAYYGAKGYLNPNNIWAYESREYAPLVGGAAGKIDQYAWARWMFMANGLIQLPYDTNLSFDLNVREGWIIREYFALVNYTIPNPASRSHTLDMTPFGSERLPAMVNTAIRLEKMIKFSDFGRIYLMVDVFNVLNSSVAIRRYQRYYGTYYYYGEGNPNNRLVPYAYTYQLNEILNPRVIRFGILVSY